jgi:hypothetical protein
VRPAHPESKHILPFDPGRVARLRHPVAEVVGADPARVQLGEEGEELLRFALKAGWGRGGVGRGKGMQEGPGAAAELFNVGRAVGVEGRRGRCSSGCIRCCAC